MAENPNDFEDEYQFNDLDNLDNIDTKLEENFDEVQSDSAQVASAPKAIDFASNDLKRKALMGVGIAILALALYKFLGSFFSSGTSPNKAVQKVPKQTTTAVQVGPRSVPVIPVQAAVSPVKVEPEITRKLDRLVFSDEANKNTLNSVKNTISSLQTTLDSLNLKINQLNNNISNLTEQVQQQHQQIVALKRKPKKRVRRVRRVVKPRISYAIQAIIPGRAWLMASNGTTITVSEGTLISGYGRVKLIDPHQGIVIMSGGKTIKFSSSDT